jgi:hypothetical protein
MFKKIEPFFLNNKYFLIGLFYLIIIVELFFWKSVSDLYYLLITISWFIFLRIFHLRPEISLYNATISFLIAFIINIFFHNDILTEKAASWFFIFILFFLIQRIFEKSNAMHE